MQLSIFVFVCLVQSLYSLILHKSSGALVVPEETPEGAAARQLHLSVLQAAEAEEEERQVGEIKGGIHGGINIFGHNGESKDSCSSFKDTCISLKIMCRALAQG